MDDMFVSGTCLLTTQAFSSPLFAGDRTAHTAYIHAAGRSHAVARCNARCAVVPLPTGAAVTPASLPAASIYLISCLANRRTSAAERVRVRGADAQTLPADGGTRY